MAAQIAQRVERQWSADRAGHGAQDLPVLARLSGRKHCAPRQLHAALGVDVGAVLFGVGGAWQDDVGSSGATVAVMALVNNKG